MVTTRAIQQALRHPREPIKWVQGPDSTSSDGFGEEFKTREKLEKHLSKPGKDDHIASTHGDTSVDRRWITALNDVVAVKSFTNVAASKWEECQNKMNNELRLIRTVIHHHIVEAVGSYTCLDTVAFLMKPCADCNLAQALAKFHRNEPLKATMERAWGREVELFIPFTMGCLAHALSHVHSKQIKHKDIKPQNILFDGNRVILSDFGISRSFEDHSTSVGPTGKSTMYASYETIDHDKRGRSQDVFSLACVFVEIFAVYKGYPADVVSCRFPDDKRNYASNIDEVLEWIRDQVLERCDVQILELIRRMTLKERKQRLLASEVWAELVTVRSNDDSTVYFCGACCMPQNPNLDANLSAASLDPTDPAYSDPPLSKATLEPSVDITNILKFQTKYSDTDIPPYTWDRNIWLGPARLVDSVGHRDEDHHLCRKSFWVEATKDQDRNQREWRRRDVKEAALAEARLLKQIAHPHIVKLRDMYRHGPDTFVILTTPVTRYNLSQYLTMVELKRRGGANIGDWKKILRISLGCLANAVNWLHTEHNVVHGDIEAENILVAPDAHQKIILAHFEYAVRKLRIEDMSVTQYGSGQNEAHYINNNLYASPDHPSSKMAQPPDDIFSLGCVFMEMETVRSGSTLRDMRVFLSSNSDQEEANATDDARSEESDDENNRRQPTMQYKRLSVLNKLPQWLEKLKPFSSGFYDLACSMVQENRMRRPNAEQVLEKIAQCKVGKEVMCGGGCLPAKEAYNPPANAKRKLPFRG